MCACVCGQLSEAVCESAVAAVGEGTNKRSSLRDLRRCEPSQQITRLAEQRSLKTLMSSYSVISDWDRGEREPGASADASPEAGRF